MAIQTVSFNPLRGDDHKKGDSEKEAAKWLRDLANDIDAKKVSGFELRMDAFGKIDGSVTVNIPSGYLTTEV